jgi:CRP-like cAMP-binding protein
MEKVRPHLLAGLTDDQAKEVVALGSRKTLAAGEILFDLGDAAESLFVLEVGRVALSLPMNIQGAERDVLIEERTPREAFGWSALVPPHRFTLKASASMESEVLALPRAALLDHFAARPEVGYAVTRDVAAVVGQRLQVLQAMWLREMQRVVELSSA